MLQDPVQSRHSLEGHFVLVKDNYETFSVFTAFGTGTCCKWICFSYVLELILFKWGWKYHVCLSNVIPLIVRVLLNGILLLKSVTVRWVFTSLWRRVWLRNFEMWSFCFVLARVWVEGCKIGCCDLRSMWIHLESRSLGILHSC